MFLLVGTVFLVATWPVGQGEAASARIGDKEGLVGTLTDARALCIVHQIARLTLWIRKDAAGAASRVEAALAAVDGRIGANRVEDGGTGELPVAVVEDVADGLALIVCKDVVVATAGVHRRRCGGLGAR